MKISVLIPCRNEAKYVSACIASCLSQSRVPEEIIVVDDASKDNTLELLRKFTDKITIISLPRSSGNKSYAQEAGLKKVTGDILITTDADTVLDKDFIKNIVSEFDDKNVIACAGYVKSIKNNWLTACRQLEYLIGQEIHKFAQSYINALFVIPGCAAAFRTKYFKKHIDFDHDTLTEDLDFTYKHHRKNFKIAYCKKAIVFTQDPSTIPDYISQLRRWYAGSWQNLVKHKKVLEKPNNALELSLIFGEGVFLPFVLILALIFNMKLFILYYLSYFVIAFLFGLYYVFSEKRIDLLLISPIHLFVSFINYAIFIEQFILEAILNKDNMVWVQTEKEAAA